MGGDEDKKKKKKDKDDEKDDGEENEKETEQKQSEEPEPEKVPLKAGDYVVQCHIIEARDLKGRGSGGMSDPVCVVQVANQKQTTRIHKNASNVVFDELKFFEMKKVEPGEVEAAKISIKVMDANTFGRDVMIGMFEFDVANVYYRKHHELFRTWVALTDITDEHEGIQGYLKLSLTVLGPGDEQHIHTPEEEDDEGDDMMSVLMPPKIEQVGRLLKIQVYEVDELPAMDEGLFGGGKCDPFVLVEFAGNKLKTSHPVGQSVPILEQLEVPVMEPIMAGKIRLSVYDWDAAGSNDRIKTIGFDYDQIKKNGFGPRWVNLYGAPLGKQRGVASKMNRDYIEGSWYRGRVLLGMSVEDKDDPKATVVKCMPLEVDKRPRTTKYTLRMDIYEGSEIADKGQMHVELSCGDHYYACAAVPVIEGRCKWYQEIKEPNGDDIVLEYPEDLDQVPDIFVYLCIKKKRISFTRLKFKDVVANGWKVPPSWVILREDMALDALDDTKAEFPGVLLFSLRAGNYSSAPPKPLPESRPLASGAWGSGTSGDDRKAVAPNQIPMVGNLRVEVIECRDLPVADFNSSDPYVKLKVLNDTKKTRIIKEDLNPKFNESFAFNKVHIRTLLEVTVKDHDIAGSDDTLGSVNVDLRTQQSSSGRSAGRDFVSDNWFLINDKYPNAAVRLKITFKYMSLVESQAAEAHMKQQAEKEKSGPLSFLKKSSTLASVTQESELGEPEQAQYQLRAHIYQARNLPAADDSGLSDPYCIIRLCGKKIKTKCIEKTINPTWYETYTVNVELPIPLTIAPHIQVFIFDRDLIGKDDPIGRFDLPVAEAFHAHADVAKITPKWYQVYDWENRPIEESTILCSFQLLDARLASAPIPSIVPDSKPMFMELTVLGLRNLQSLIGVHKPYVDFELPGAKHFKTQKSKAPSAKNPNFLEILKLPIDLPLDKLYAPTVDISVKDSLFGGLVTRTLGNANLPLSTFMIEDGKGGWVGGGDVEVLDSDAVEEEIKVEAEQKATEAARRQKEAEDAKARKEAESKERATRERGDTASQPLLSSDGQESVEMDSLSHESDEDDVGLGLGIGDLPDLNLLPDPDDEDKYSDEADNNAAKERREEEEAKEEKEAKPPEEFGKEQPSGYSTDALVEQDDSQDEEPKPPYLKGRPVVNNELEDVVKCEPFHSIPLFTGQKNATFGVGERRQVGKWKGLIRLIEHKDDKPAFDTKELLVPRDLFLRIYILRGTKLMPADSDGTSDPYLKIKIGNQKVSTRSDYHKSTLEPEFYDSFEIPVTIPGDAVCKIDVWDWDGIGDDLIGSTEIDIEDRWFSKNWRKLPKKPLEFRTLHSPSSSAPQGKLIMWMEILTPVDAKKEPLINIKPPPPDPYELRVVIWGCRDVTIKDTMTDMNDLYITCSCSVPGLKQQETDTHWRSKKGKGNFNWRMKFPLLLPIKGMWPRLRFQIWDRDILSANDSICEAVISMKGLCKQSLKEKDRVKLIVQGKDRVWLDNLRHPNEEGSQGRMEFSVELLPEALGTQLPAGFGRSDPNSNPFLPEPEGRLNLSLFHPLDMIRDLCGEGIYRKICLGIICGLLMAAIGFTAPMIFSNLMSKLLLP